MSSALVPRAFVVLLFVVEVDGYLSGRTVGRRRNVLFRGNGNVLLRSSSLQNLGFNDSSYVIAT